MRKFATVTVSALLLALAAASGASATPSITAAIPLESETDTNSKIIEGPEGAVWLAVHSAKKDVARITPDGNLVEFELEGIENPSGMAVGPEKKIWITALNKVASFSPADPAKSVQVFENKLIEGASPIAAGPDGQMWAGSSEKLIHFNPLEPEKEEFFPIAEMGPRDIESQGTLPLLVIADAGSPRVLRVNTAGQIAGNPIVIGHEKAGKQEGASQGIAVAPDGAIGFSQPGSQPEQVGFVDTAGTVRAFEREGDPFGVAYGSDHAFWYALAGASATSPAGIERVTESGETSFFSQIPPEFKIRQITSGPGNTIWATAENEKPGNPSKVIEVSGLEPPVAEEHKAPETKLKGPKGKVKTRKAKAAVKFTFSSSTADSKFECALVKLPTGKKHKKAPKPKFKGCKSPETLKLKPGKYKFSVRAVANGVVDPSPATKSFSVVRVRLHSHGVS